MNKTRHFPLLIVLLCFLFGFPAMTFAQTTTLKYEKVEELEIGGVEVKGIFFSDPNAIRSVSGLQAGQKIKIPGKAITKAMRNLWRLKLFDNVVITQDKRVGDVVFLSIHLTEKSRLVGWSYRGVPQSVHDDLNAVVEPFLIKGQVASQAMEINAKNAIKKYYVKRGFYDCEVEVTEEEAGE